jgi:phosphomannomutase
VFVLTGPRTRAVIRPSGTEPKLKAYLEVVEPAPADTPALWAARGRARDRLDTLRAQVSAMIGAPETRPAGGTEVTGQ